jgi:hypothetical protein
VRAIPPSPTIHVPRSSAATPIFARTGEQTAAAGVVLTAQGPLKGKAGVEAFFKQAFSLLPQAQISARQIVSSGGAFLVWWSAESPAGRVDDGVDTFIFE